MELDHFGRLGSRHWSPAFVFPVGPRLGDTLPLTLQQKTALEFGDSRQHRDHELAGWSAGIDPLTSHAEHDQANATAIQVIHNAQQVHGAPGKAIWLTADQRVASADEPQGLAETIT